MLPAHRDIVLNYMDVDGFVSIDRKPDNAYQKNGLMQTGLYVCMLDHLNDLDEHDTDAFYHTVMECWARDSRGIIRGLLNRLKGCTDRESFDDYRGVVAGGEIAKFDFPLWVWRYGLKNRFVYNNVTPGAFQWWAFFGRFVVDWMWYAALEAELGCVFSPVLMALLALRLFSGASSGHLLDYMIVRSMKRRPGWQWFGRLWVKWGKLVESSDAYFKPGHPMTLLALEVERRNRNGN